ncbi:ribonuclease E inhibitor RraB [Streptosporangium sp. NPDC049078]|uniref:ribonuclease E inhibitor RraB n=1 Tax=Streptosporangium sp. NPDC049078 TaxID=3155767 RepID=UPI003423408F
MWPFRRKKHEQVDLEERSPELGIKYKDLMVMHQLTKAGADLEQPRHVDFYLYAPTFDAAQSIAKEANGAGYGLRPEIGKPSPEHPDSWPVTCETTAVISPDFVRETGNLFDDLAARYHAKYDGWGAAATP